MGRVQDALLCNGCQHWLKSIQGGSNPNRINEGSIADPAAAVGNKDQTLETEPAHSATVKTSKNICGCVSKVDITFKGFGLTGNASSSTSETKEERLMLHDTIRSVDKSPGGDQNKQRRVQEAKACNHILKCLADEACDVNEQDEDGVSALCLAAFEGLADVVLALVKHGATLDHRTLAGLTALMLAANRGHAGVAEILLSNGASPDLCDLEGWTALMTATSLNSVQCMTKLCNHGADLNKPTSNDDNHTPMMVASQNGFSEAVKFLLMRGAALELKDAEGMTALMRATHENQAVVVHLLLDAGADVEARNTEGMSALMWAAYEGHCTSDNSVAALLLKSGAKIGVVDKYGEDALTLAQQRGFGPQMSQLVDRFGCTPTPKKKLFLETSQEGSPGGEAAPS